MGGPMAHSSYSLKWPFLAQQGFSSAQFEHYARTLCSLFHFLLVSGYKFPELNNNFFKCPLMGTQHKVIASRGLSHPRWVGGCKLDDRVGVQQMAFIHVQFSLRS